MEYENRPVPEHINVSSTHPLVEFGFLLGGVALICGTLFGAAYALAGLLLPWVPFSLEETVVDSVGAASYLEEPLEPLEQSAEDALQALAERLLQNQPLPEGMHVEVHFSDSADANAFAALGGHIVIHRGLLASVSSENALAMVLAHEIGHIVHRDPLLATGRAAVAVAALAMISGFSESAVADTLFNVSANTLMMSYSRDQERAADAYALDLLQKHYGHLGGAAEFFAHRLEQQFSPLRGSELLEFMSTHPDLDERLEAIEAQRGPGSFPTVPLGDALLAVVEPGAGADPEN